MYRLWLTPVLLVSIALTTLVPPARCSQEDPPPPAGWTEFLRAVTSLESGDDRARAARLFRVVVGRHPECKYAPDSRELAEFLDKMAEEDRAWKEPLDRDKLQEAKWIQYNVHHLRDVTC